MKQRTSLATPSMTKRVVVGSLLSLLVLTPLLLAAIFAITQRGYLATEHAATLLGGDLRRDTNGRLSLESGADILELAERSPGLWFIAADGARTLEHGAPPSDARLVFGPAARSLGMFEADIDLRLGPDLEKGHTTTTRVPTDFGAATVMVGGVDPKTFGWRAFSAYVTPAMVALLIPVLVVMGVVIALVVVPIIRKGVRPLSRAAAELDGRDLTRRIPEAGVMSELLPVVRALNGALDRLEEAFDARRRFMADVAHEFSTPMAVLTMHADELPDGPTKSNLQRGIFRMSQMVGQMLDTERLSRPDRPRESVDLVAVAKAAVADTAPLAVDAGYTIEFSAAREVITVGGDQHAIRRAVTNLLANAVAHAGGSGAIRVRVTADAVVEVEDEGAGVPEEARERVFEPFHRERWDKDGCGLGLHLVREIMRAHAGRAEVGGRSPGAVFRLVFPQQLSAT